MSAVITTATPFTIKDVLVNTLDELGYEPTIITDENIATFVRRYIRDGYV